MFEYKALCSNHPVDATELNRMGQENWELCGVCTIAADDDVGHHLQGIPANSETAGEIRYVAYFKRAI